MHPTRIKNIIDVREGYQEYFPSYVNIYRKLFLAFRLQKLNVGIAY
jgi:hypothetical protein